MAVDASRVGWLYQARRVAQQTNGAGGAIIIDISLAAGQIARLVSLAAINSGTNTLVVATIDEDLAANARLATLGSAAGNTVYLPSIGQAATASVNVIQSTGLLLAPSQKLMIQQTAAGLDDDTLTVAVTLLLYNVSTEPTWDKSRSTNAGDVTLAANSIATAVTPLVVNPP